MVNLESVRFRWKLKSFLASKNLSVYSLAQEMAKDKEVDERGNQSLLYRIKDGDSVSITTRNLERILTGIQGLGVKDVSILDVVVEE